MAYAVFEAKPGKKEDDEPVPGKRPVATFEEAGPAHDLAKKMTRGGKSFGVMSSDDPKSWIEDTREPPEPGVDAGGEERAPARNRAQGQEGSTGESGEDNGEERPRRGRPPGDPAARRVHILRIPVNEKEAEEIGARCEDEGEGIPFAEWARKKLLGR